MRWVGRLTAIGGKHGKYSVVWTWVFIVGLRVRLWHQHVGKFSRRVHSNEKMSEIYHRLMIKKYGSKREKFQVAKHRAADEQRPVREMEEVMDVELFLEGQGPMGRRQPSPLGNNAQNVPACSTPKGGKRWNR